MTDIHVLEESIYQTALIPALWPQLLDTLARTVGAEGALLANMSNEKLPWVASDGVGELYEDFFDGGWNYQNARSETLVARSNEGFISDIDFFTHEQMAAEPIYGDFLWRRNFGYATGTVLQSGGAKIAISIEKHRDKGPVGLEELAYLNRLRPHLARATSMAAHAELGKIEAALQAFDMAQIPCAIIRMDGRLLNANTRFERFGASIGVGANDMLTFSEQQAQQFYRSIQSFSRRYAASFPIKAANQHPAAVLHFIPVVGVARELFLHAAYFLTLAPVNDHIHVPAPMLKGLYDLTPTEARVAEALVEGLTVAEITERIGCAQETVRTHVKAILSKARMASQRDFVAAMSSISSVKF
ncbi:helix-turn-helix transcriptional regulator [Rhizobium oryzicola]|uniref:LuxR C-terminal-related transcriptional regulator n=1 Tax=Rhizobium oryzicola TaxID=1232668 RepID=A0ABT8T5L7_9HYPH|nr:LuxR C-terminal-related transcriptional regulator [Rhizobium oryzicola]MDO1585338.1 LuxR C-terminal-related transcriptional regulator [Rhizobium oryzicola]